MRVEDWEREIGRVAWNGPRTATCAGVAYTVSANRVSWTSAQGASVAVSTVVNAMAGWKVFELVIDGKVVEATNDTSVVRNQRVRDAMDAAIGCAVGAAREWAPAPAPKVAARATKATKAQAAAEGRVAAEANAGITATPAAEAPASGSDEPSLDSQETGALSAAFEPVDDPPSSTSPDAAVDEPEPAGTGGPDRDVAAPADPGGNVRGESSDAPSPGSHEAAAPDPLVEPGPEPEPDVGVSTLSSEAAAVAEAQAVVEAVNEADAGPAPDLPEPIPFRPRKPRARRTPPENGTR